VSVSSAGQAPIDTDDVMLEHTLGRARADVRHGPNRSPIEHMPADRAMGL
jgi:hypothetical protein